MGKTLLPLSWRLLSGRNSLQPPHKQMLHLAYWRLTILLHRPFFLRKSRPIHSTDCEIDHVKVSTYLLQVARKLYNLLYLVMSSCCRKYYGIKTSTYLGSENAGTVIPRRDRVLAEYTKIFFSRTTPEQKILILGKRKREAIMSSLSQVFRYLLILYNHVDLIYYRPEME